MRVIVIRHGEREDHVNFDWQNSAHRVHDSPLSGLGIEQAHICGKRLLEEFGGSLEGKELVTLVSPLQRCVSTAKHILEELNVGDNYAIRIEEAFSEANSYLWNRMFGKSKTSNKINKLSGKPRTLTKPVLMGPGDLIGMAYPFKINLAHTMIHRVFHSDAGYEILNEPASNGNTKKKSMIQPKGLLDPVERFKVVVPKFKNWLQGLEDSHEGPEDLVVLVVTHGAVASTFTQLFTPDKLQYGFQYCTTAQIVKEKDEFRLVDFWNMPGLEPKSIQLT